MPTFKCAEHTARDLMPVLVCACGDRRCVAAYARRAFRDKKEVGMVRGAGACSDSCQHSFRPSSTQCLSLHSCLFADESSLEELVVKHQGDKWSTTGQGQTLGGAEVAQSEMSEREKRLAALEKRGL
eukprot:4976137-Prymnesium_polylepis.1